MLLRALVLPRRPEGPGGRTHRPGLLGALTQPLLGSLLGGGALAAACFAPGSKGARADVDAEALDVLFETADQRGAAPQARRDLDRYRQEAELEVAAARPPSWRWTARAPQRAACA